jgi:hypothetical protein
MRLGMFLLRAIAVWLVLMVAEVIHGILRGLLLVPLVGDLRARQVGVFVGSLLILVLTYLFVRWIRAGSPVRLLAVGGLWLVLTVLFEFALGRLVLGLPWQQIRQDYDLPRGGLMLFGLLVIALSPLLMSWWRGEVSTGHVTGEGKA